MLEISITMLQNEAKNGIKATCGLNGKAVSEHVQAFTTVEC